MYYSGTGVPQSNEEAFMLLEKAAKGGDPRSQLYVAAMYEKGEGVAQSFTEARGWYMAAAEQAEDYDVRRKAQDALKRY